MSEVSLEEARKFLQRLIGGMQPDNHEIDVGVKVTSDIRKRKKHKKRKDPIANVSLDDDEKAVKQDVALGMGKVRQVFDEMAKMNNDGVNRFLEEFDEKGRDKMAYATFTRKGKMSELLRDWKPSWPIEKTAGLLLDISLTVKDARQDRGEELLSDTLEDSRGEHHKVDKDSEWVKKFLPKGTEVKSGASATTAQLLLMLEEMDVPLPQVEAILNGVIKFWDGFLKKTSGAYHTAAEVWAVWNEHLEKRLRAQWEANKKPDVEESEESSELEESSKGKKIEVQDKDDDSEKEKIVEAMEKSGGDKEKVIALVEKDNGKNDKDL
jgi:hypothetical protein